MTEYQPYGVRHFLRRADPEGASELRRRTVPLGGGGTLEKGEFADTDELALGGLLVYRTLVLRRSPSQSRPPSPYALRRSGDFYEVWQRPPGGGRQGLIEHMGLGTGLDPGAVPDCGRVIALAELAPPGARLLAAVAPPLRFLSLGDFPRPADWATAPEDPRLVTPQSSGDLRASVEAAGGEYEFWLGGSVSGSVELRVDGAQVAGVRGQLNNDGQYVSLGQGTLREGGNELLLRYSAGGWHPGSEVPQEPVGPLVLRPVLGAEPILSAAPAAARRLCGRRLDWIELVKG
jgi:hypothetical protein